MVSLPFRVDAIGGRRFRPPDLPSAKYGRGTAGNQRRTALTPVTENSRAGPLQPRYLRSFNRLTLGRQIVVRSVPGAGKRPGGAGAGKGGNGAGRRRMMMSPSGVTTGGS